MIDSMQNPATGVWYYLLTAPDDSMRLEYRVIGERDGAQVHSEVKTVHVLGGEAEARALLADWQRTAERQRAVVVPHACTWSYEFVRCGKIDARTRAPMR